MFKRPFIWVLASYLAGMYLAGKGLAFHIVLSAVFFIFILICLLPKYLKGFNKNLDKGFRLILTVIVIIGFLAMRERLKEPIPIIEDKAVGTLSGTITRIVDKKYSRVLYLSKNTLYLSFEESYQSENVIVYCFDNHKYQIGNLITVYGEIHPFSRPTNPGQFNEFRYNQIQNIDYKIMAEKIKLIDSSYSVFHESLSHIKGRLLNFYQDSVSEKEYGVLAAMLLGEKQHLEEEISQLYRENGISHIIAISGLHITLIGLAIYQLLRKCRVPLIPATVVSLFLIYSYGILTNFSISTNRAIVMLIILLLARVFGRTYDLLSALSLSAFLILLQNPLQIFHVGFLFSFSAVLGIAILYPCLLQIFPVKNKLVNAFFVSISIQLMTLPVLLYFYYQLPVYGVIMNLFVLPCMAILIPSALISGLVGMFYIPLGVFLIGGANFILGFYEGLCRVGSRLPGSLYTAGKPYPCQIVFYLFLLFLFVYLIKRYQRRLTLLILPFAVFIIIFTPRIKGLSMTMLDVGQGDGIVIQTETNNTYMIDGGSSDVSKVGIYRILPFLLSRGIRKIDYVIITHADYDHISGVIELLEGKHIKINHLILPITNLTDSAYESLRALAAECNVKVHYIKAGDTIQDKDLSMTCLHPALGYHAKVRNAYSTVLSLKYKEFDMLFTGDLESEGEALLMNGLTNSASDYPFEILKVAHHASKTSSQEEFLQLINPKISLISCGRNNKRVTRLIQFRFPCSSL